MNEKKIKKLNEKNQKNEKNWMKISESVSRVWIRRFVVSGRPRQIHDWERTGSCISRKNSWFGATLAATTVASIQFWPLYVSGTLYWGIQWPKITVCPSLHPSPTAPTMGIPHGLHLPHNVLVSDFRATWAATQLDWYIGVHTGKCTPMTIPIRIEFPGVWYQEAHRYTRAFTCVPRYAAKGNCVPTFRLRPESKILTILFIFHSFWFQFLFCFFF